MYINQIQFRAIIHEGKKRKFPSEHYVEKLKNSESKKIKQQFNRQEQREGTNEHFKEENYLQWCIIFIHIALNGRRQEKQQKEKKKAKTFCNGHIIKYSSAILGLSGSERKFNIVTRNCSATAVIK